MRKIIYMSYCFFFISKTQALAKSIANVNFSIILYFILYHIFFQKIKWICFLTDFNHTFTKMCRIFYNLYIIKHFRKFTFMSWMNYSSLSRLYITWENGQFKKKINIHLTRLNQLEVLWSYSQSDISRPPPFWKSIYFSLEMSERNISLRVYLQMMYFLSVIGMGGSSVCVWRGGGGGHLVTSPLT